MIDAFANLATKRKEVSVCQSVLLTKPTSTENVNAQLVKASSMGLAELKTNVPLTHTGTKKLNAASATLVSESLMEDVATINIVVKTDILNMDNAIVKMDTSGS